jgi:hypothetical protein
MSGANIMSPNYSGFSSFPIGSIYPNYGSGFAQSDDTIPEASEQAAYTMADSSAPFVEVPGTKRNFWIFIAVAVAIVYVVAIRK